MYKHSNRYKVESHNKRMKEKEREKERDLREELAELCHEQWSSWMEYLFSKCDYGTLRYTNVGVMYISKKAVDRWKRQMNTDYKDLSEEEKDSDRKEADKFLGIMREGYNNERSIL